MATFCACTHTFWSPPPGAAITLLNRLATHFTHLLAPVPLPIHPPSIFINITPNLSAHPPGLPNHPPFKSNLSGTHIHIHPSGLHALICPSICPPICPLSVCLGLEPTPVCHLSVHHLHLDSDQLHPGSVPSSIHLSVHPPVWDLVFPLSPLGDFHI